MGSLRMTAKLSRKYIAPERANTIHLLIDLEAMQKETGKDRLPLNLGFVIDRSGSMSGKNSNTPNRPSNMPSTISHRATSLP